MTDDYLIARRGSRTPDSAPGADTRPAPGTFETIGAGFRAARADTTGYDEEQKSEAYGEVITALADLGYSVDRYVSPSRGSTGIAYDRVYRDVMREKARGRFKDLPDTQAAFEKKWRAETAARIAQAEDTAGRGGGVARFAGGVAGTMTDPVNLMTLPIGGIGKTVATRVITEGLANMAIEAVSQPIVNAQRREFGRRELTTEESLTNVAMAGVGGAVIRGGIEVAPAAGRMLGQVDAKAVEIAAPVRAKVDSVFAERDMAREFSRQVPVFDRTPEQRAALHVIGRAEEVEAVNPFANTYEGIDAHTAKLNAAMEEIESGRIATPAPRAVPEPVSPAARARVASPGASSGSFDMARYMGRNRIAESGGSDVAAAETSSAYGRYQFLKDTWIATYRATFGDTGESAAEILRKRGDGAVQDKVMATFTRANVRVLERAGVPVTDGTVYLSHFLGAGDAVKVMRAAPDTPIGKVVSAASIKANRAVFKDVRTAGDLAAWSERKMGGRGGAGAAAPVRAAENDSEWLAALAAEEADIAAARGRVDGDMADLFDEGGAPRAVGDAPVPELRRDLFPDETSWRIAQAAAEAETGGHAPIVTRQSVWDDARARLEADGRGEIAGALYHPEVGAIAVKWGNAKSGLAHIAADHPEVLDDLPEIIASLELDAARSGKTRAVLQSPDHKAVVALNYHEKEQRWLLTAYRRDGGELPPSGRTSRRGPNDAPDGGSTGAGGAADIGVPGGEGKMTPGQLLSSYWERTRDPEPFWVARGKNGAVKGWSAHKGELEAREGGEGVTIARESGPDAGGEVSPALAKQMDLFDDHAGAGARMVAESDWHDVRASEAMRAMTIDIGDGSGARSVAEIEAELDIADAGLKAMRECMA